MSSPFPGMDPWLEDPAIFPDLCHSLLIGIKGEINRILPAPYYAALAVREWYGESKGPNSERFVQVFADRRSRTPLAVVEILSVAVKTLRNVARTIYLKNRKKLVAQGVVIIEIDLLRGGEATSWSATEAPVLIEGFHYHASIRYPDSSSIVYPWLLGGRIPRIPLNLGGFTSSITLDLQRIFDECYDAALYDRRVQYRDFEHEPPLTERQKVWAGKRLDAAGL